MSQVNDKSLVIVLCNLSMMRYKSSRLKDDDSDRLIRMSLEEQIEEVKMRF